MAPPVLLSRRPGRTRTTEPITNETRTGTMADFTAADVKRLRELTAAGMMDCKNALVESDGDFEKAVEILRTKGAKDVGKRAGRVAANGLVAVSGPAIIELNCETDFVAKSTQFQELAGSIAALVEASRPADVEATLAATLPDGQTVQGAIDAVSAVIGEKLELRRIAVLDGTIATYVHRKDPALPPQIGVLVAYEGSDEQAAKTVAQQVAAMRPIYLDRDDVPADTIEAEQRIAEATARKEGKPEAALPRIIEGKVTAYYKDFVLLEQPSVTDGKKSVKQLLEEAGVTVTGFARFEVGAA
jgi:elongation factor Ts